MAPSRKLANGRSPIVNQQRQITSFFTKTNSPSPSPTPIIPNQRIPKSDLFPNPNPIKSPNLTPTTPSPHQSKSKSIIIDDSCPITPDLVKKSYGEDVVYRPQQTKSKTKKPLLIIGDSCPITPDLVKKSYGEEVVNRRVRVYWPLDQSWYEGRVKSFDKASGKHLVQYDDAEEEELELSKEKIEWTNEKSKGLRRLRRVSLVVDDDLEDEKVESDGDDDDSTDEDWGKGAVNELVDTDRSEDMELDDEVEEEYDEEKETESPKQFCGKGSVLKKRKTSRVEKLGSGKKSKGCGNVEKIGGLKVSLDGNGSQMMSPVKNVDSGKAPQIQAIGATGDASERFGIREAEKFCFLLEGRRDANRRRPEDEDYDPRTLYLPPNFLNNLTGGQRQWWEFKSKHMDKVLFFKMGKFYELFEMDAHVGARELDLQYMKGEQPHCGFPEKNFSVNVEKLARKGFRVLVVEQTETPEQLDIRRKEKGSKDKVVKREICAVVTKGTLTEGEMMSTNPDASYLMAVTESYQALESTEEERCFGVCVVDVATSKIILGQFDDDSECSALASLLTELRPVEIIKPAKLLSPGTEKILLRHTRNPLVNELVPTLECWDAEKTVCKLKSIYSHIKNQSGDGYSDDLNSHDTNIKAEEDGINYLPNVLVELIRVEKDCCYALSALGGALFYLKEAFLDETLLRFAKFELLPCSGFSGICQKPYMVLDAPALESLEIFENSRNGDSSGTLYAQLNHCVTAFGKRMLKTWLARPLYQFSSIKERQDAVAGLRGVNLPFALDFQKELCRLPDMERLLARLFASSEANGRNANKVVLYEDASKKQLQEFISALRGCELMANACSSLGTILDNIDCSLLHHLLTPGTGLPDISSAVKHFKDAFDWAEANNSGRIIPLEGVDVEYDSACKMVKDVESCLAEHLQNQRKFLGQKSISYVTIGKEAYLLEVPESLGKSIPQEYEFRSSKKGYHRYWNPTIKKYLGELSQAQSEKESKLKSILQRLIGRFCEHHSKWRQLVSVTAELDVLISLAIASDYYEGPTCRPNISSLSLTNEVPCLGAKSLGHPVLRSDSLGKGTFVPNDINIGGSGHASFILLTGPNMGGKSTLLRQICLAVILAQVGADVPAESFELSPVDQIFVRMGAKDHIMAGQSTFLTELSETASMLSSATRNSLVVLDELGRGTSTSDGQAIAESVLEHFVHKVKCRGMFSTHYHRLAVDYQNDTKVSLNHMGCQIGKGVGGVEEVTFLYRIMPGACPKSHGVNVARLAGLPDSVLRKSADMSLAFEAIYGKHKKESKNVSIEVWEDEVVDFLKKLTNVVTNMSSHEFSEGMDISTLTKLQQRASTLLQNH